MIFFIEIDDAIYILLFFAELSLAGLAIIVVVLCAAVVNAERNVLEESNELLIKRDNDVSPDANDMVETSDCETMNNEMTEDNDGDNVRSHVNKRAAVSNESLLWPNEIIYYNAVDAEEYSNPTLVIQDIEDAMKAWSDVTCLEFRNVTNQISNGTFNGRYISFMKGDSCDSIVGYQENGEQIVELSDECVEEMGSLIRVFGHVIGLWPEISRPDRDNYINEIRLEYILDTKEDNFNKSRDDEIDYQGIGYDYSSIMHYNNRTDYLNTSIDCVGKCETFVVNETEYEKQGFLELGNISATAPSINDTNQVKRMYKCPGEGYKGILVVIISHLKGISRDQYVVVKGIDALGKEYTMNTKTLQSEDISVYNEEILEFSYNEWQFFRIRVWSKNNSESTESMSETVPLLQDNNFQMRQHCINTPPKNSACINYLNYRSGLFLNYTLNITLKFVTSTNISCICKGIEVNPFVKIKAYDINGASEENIHFHTKGEYVNRVYFNSNTIWKQFTVHVWDNKIYSYDEKLSHSHCFDVYSSMINISSADNIHLKVYGGYIEIQYLMIKNL